MHRPYLAALALLAALAAVAADPPADAVKAIKRFRVPDGLKATLWAAEPLLANPVAFCFDERGRCYVAEGYRLEKGVTDNRWHMSWLDDDLACRTVADRVAMFRRHLKDKARGYETDSDRVKLVWDADGDGAADRAAVFADGFKDIAAGLGAGVLARKETVYFTNIPDLWLLKDTKGAGRADVTKSLANGFGVHVAFFGHDMHGLCVGPDGKLYFSIGDRGLNVTTKEGKKLFNPDSGAVLRCDPDGANLELVATGLRNPQELAFDAHGDLFTVDNNSDSGDRARLVHVVEGGDSGWRVGYQYGSAIGDRGPWNAEKIWHLANPDQPAYVVPPLAHITSGPSGLCFNYGATALPERYRDHFFVCDFRGESGNSGIYSFAVKSKGASFEIADGHEFLGGVLATDCDFAPDGGFYVLDWVDGWRLTGKGRVYRFADEQAAKNPAVAEVKRLLGEGFDNRPNEELAKLLEHADLRVRQEAQFALAGRGVAALPALTAVAKGGKNRPARLHAIWGLGQVGRAGTNLRLVLRDLLKDADDEVRAQAARAVGWHREPDGNDVVPLLADPRPRVRLQAALTLGRRGVGFDVHNGSLVSVLRFLENDADRDPTSRHAGGLVLARFAPHLVVSLKAHTSPAVRLIAVLALRHQKSESAREFLDDPDPRVALEAARFLHDELPPTAGAALAERLGKAKQPELFQARALNAHFRLGKAANAAAVARFAARGDAPEGLRIEAVRMLGMWARPPRRDRVTGLTQDLGTRDGAVAAGAFKAALGGLFTGPDAVRREAARVAAGLGVKEVGPALFEAATDGKRPAEVRVEMLRALEALNDARLERVRESALRDADPRLRAEGRRLLAKAKPAEALSSLLKALREGETVEKQSALAVLGDMGSAATDGVLGIALDRLLGGTLPAEIHLDLLEAAGRRPALKEKLRRFEERRDKKDPLANYREALAGGDAGAGRQVFLTKAEASCVRCHKVQGEGGWVQGGEVGPDLTGIGSKQNREYLLEAIVDPNRRIAQGFETVVLELTNGTAVSGVLKGEDPKEVRLMTPEGKLAVVPRDRIEGRARGKSAMPEDVMKHLTRRELRDLVEFLAGLRATGRDS